MNQLTPGSPAARGERPLIIRGSILLFGLIVWVTTVQRWRGLPPEAEADMLALFWLPMLLGASMVLQYFAKTRNSRLLLVSAAIGLLVLIAIVIRIRS